jgi:CRISPR-associated protein Cas8b/Csh1 subtype I-B
VLGALVDQTNAKNVIVLRFVVQGKRARYVGLQFEEKGSDELYLYRKDRAGRGLGLFLTGRIKKFDLLNLQRLRRKQTKEANEAVKIFLQRKLDWIPVGAIVTNEHFLSMMKKPSRTTLESLLREYRLRRDRIHRDFLKKIETHDPEELLVTVKLVQGSKERFVGELSEYVAIFREAVTGLKGTQDKGQKQRQTSPLHCAVCNRSAVSAKFNLPPLPFFTTDKPGFIPSGERSDDYKVFPLCRGCYLDLQLGRSFIEQHLDFAITSVDGTRAEVRFWLIPMLDDPQLSVDYLEDIGKAAKGARATRFLYLGNLRGMCRSMSALSYLDDIAEPSEKSEFLTFTALFYTYDTQGHMRTILRAEGIYPKHLKFVAEVKKRVDSLPYDSQQIRFGFPLLRDFLVAPKSEGWYKDLASTLANILTGTPVNKALVYRAVSTRILDIARKTGSLRSVAELALKALNLVEYIEQLEPNRSQGNFMSSQGTIPSSSKQVHRVRAFLDGHPALLRDETLRAVCATGIATGILLQVQFDRTKGKMPFWTRLNRLEMDLNRIRQLFPQILNKLHEYDTHTYDELLSYLGSSEVSRLETREGADEVLLSFVFAVGLAEGYFIVGGQDTGGEGEN